MGAKGLAGGTTVPSLKTILMKALFAMLGSRTSCCKPVLLSNSFLSENSAGAADLLMNLNLCFSYVLQLGPSYPRDPRRSATLCHRLRLPFQRKEPPDWGFSCGGLGDKAQPLNAVYSS